MKQLPLVIVGLLPITGFSQKEKTGPYQLSAEVNFPEYDQSGRVIYFVYQQNGKQKIDSAVIEKNKCSFHGTADINMKASLQFTKPGTTPEPALDPNTLNFYLGETLTSIKATGNISKAKVGGSPVQDEYASFKQQFVRLDRMLTMYGRRKRVLKETDSLQMHAVNKSIDSVQNSKMQVLCDFLDKGIARPYAAEAIAMYLKAKGTSFDIDKAANYFQQLPQEQKQSPDGLEVEKLIASLRKNPSL